ncbi:hypothetical protein [Nostoc sp. TCL26-01]|uniref:hypothetical protein n=1 Tax=Nostoc sp. TCL26-01 TaxID=2576904 RepID=UPI0015BDBB62|nr:hypothetical protein [Nostoc sp. TCL26-01]QLE59824.1 hypothetical protein FD725_30800 [Nostoc sp. TCL26-01]
MNCKLVNRLFLAVLTSGFAVLVTSCQKTEQNSSVPQSSFSSKPFNLRLIPSKLDNSPLLKSNTSLLLPQTAKQSCGDTSTGSETAWYPVFIDYGNLANINRELCADAIETTRKDTGILSVQVASFSNRDRAVAFANKVGGNVGKPTFVNGESQSDVSVSDSRGEVLTPVETELPPNNNLTTIEPPVQPNQIQAAPIKPPDISSCAFDFSPNSNCSEQLFKYQQYVEKQIQESANNRSQIRNQISSNEGYNSGIHSMQTQINVDKFLNNQKRSIDNQNFLIQQRNASRCATTTSLVC